MRTDLAFETWKQKARAVRIEDELARRGIKLARQGKELVGPCPKCGGDDRFSINIAKQVFNCRGCQARGDVIDLVMFLDDCDFVPAGTTLAGEPPPKANGNASPTTRANGKAGHAEPKVAARYSYTDEAGNLLFQVERVELQNPDGSFVLQEHGKRKKTFRQRRPYGKLKISIWGVGAGEYMRKSPDQDWYRFDAQRFEKLSATRERQTFEAVKLVPYRLPELTEAIAGERVIFITEGEAKVDFLRSWNVPATCNAGGAEKWNGKHAAFLRGADVVILPDHDDAGRSHAEQVAQSLVGIASRTRMLKLPGLEAKGDIVDWAKDHTREELDSLVEQAPDWQPSEVHAEAKSQTLPEGVSLDDFRAYMPLHNFIYMPSREAWPGSSVNARLGKIPLIGADGKPVLEPASTWLDRNRPVEQATWAPGLPMLIADRLIADGGWVEQPKVTVLNLYRPPRIIPGDAAKAEPWVDHVRKVFPQDADHLIRWLAHRVQRPAEKINHGVVLGGKPGIGKDTLLEPVKHAVGPWNFIEVSPQQMLGRFNGFAKSVILRISEARDLGDINRFQFYDHMKVFTAAPPDVLRVDEKNLREHNVINCCGVVITTNYKSDGIYLPAEDRRHFVAWSELGKGDFADDYWRHLWRWYEQGGYGHVAAYLRQLDLAGFDPKAPPLKTEAFWSIVDANRAPEDADLADVLDKLGRPPAVTIGRVIAEAMGDFAEWIMDRKNRRVLPHRFEQCGYTPVRNGDANDGLWVIGSKRQVIYAKAELPIRDRLRAAARLTAE